jgi:hypothetical protein
MASSLQNKVSGNNDYDVNSSLSFDSEHRLRAENLCFDIDTWYRLLEDFTFRSVFIPLQKIEALAILAYNDVSWRHKRSSLTEKEVELLKNLEACIDAEVKALIDAHIPDSASDKQKDGENEVSVAVFLRFCGRSPKDGDPADHKSITDRYKRELDRLLSSGYPGE